MPLAPILLRYGLPALAAIGVLFGVYTKGRSDCAVKHAQEEAKAADEWAERVTAASTDAFAAALKIARQEGTDRKDLKDVVEEAPSTGHVCVSADAVERLRQLQAD